MGGAAQVVFVNDSTGDMTLYWIDHNGNVQQMGPIWSYDTMLMDTTVGHNFVALDSSGNCRGGLLAVSHPGQRFDIR